jgi:hypothetical protein
VSRYPTATSRKTRPVEEAVEAGGDGKQTALGATEAESAERAAARCLLEEGEQMAQTSARSSATSSSSFSARRTRRSARLAGAAR